MGAAPMRSLHHASLTRSEESIVKLMLPVYYCGESISDRELDAAKASWVSIANNSAPGYLTLRKLEKEAVSATCIGFFNECFFMRLFDIHPMCKDLFKDTSRQGKFLVKMISLALSERSDPARFESTLVTLAGIHNDRGVKAAEYGLVGDVILWAIRQCLGNLAYTELVQMAWIKIISRMLATMVPLAVAYEISAHSHVQIQRVQASYRLTRAVE